MKKTIGKVFFFVAFLECRNLCCVHEGRHRMVYGGRKDCYFEAVTLEHTKNAVKHSAAVYEVISQD